MSDSLSRQHKDIPEYKRHKNTHKHNINSHTLKYRHKLQQNHEQTLLKNKGAEQSNEREKHSTRETHTSSLGTNCSRTMSNQTLSRNKVEQQHRRMAK